METSRWMQEKRHWRMSAQPGASCPFLLRRDWAGHVWVPAKGQSQGRAHRAGGSVTTHPPALGILVIWLPPPHTAQVYWICACDQRQLDLGNRPLVQEEEDLESGAWGPDLALFSHLGKSLPSLGFSFLTLK